MKRVIFAAYKRTVNIFSKTNLRRFRVIDSLNTFIRSRLKPEFIESQGHKIYLDSNDSLHLSIHKNWEDLETEIVKKHVSKGDFVLDLGANIGYYTLLFAKIVGDSGRVYAFEPDPVNFALLKKNVEVNNYNNVVLVQKAVSNKSEKSKLYLCEGNLADHRIYDTHNGRKSIQIETTKLDDFFNDKNIRFDFIKMDIEGAEGGAVQGMRNILKRSKNIKIITEFYPEALEGFGIGAREYLNLLLRHNFKFFMLDEKEKKIREISAPKLLKEYPKENRKFTNLLCIKKQYPKDF